MKYARAHLSDSTLTHQMAANAARERAATADLLADIAEFDGRKLYANAGFPSMFAYCVGPLRLSESAAYLRIRAARMARRWPEIFTTVADGRLHLTAIALLAPHLTSETASELLLAASHKSKTAIEILLAERFPRPDFVARVTALPVARAPETPALLVPQQAAGILESLAAQLQPEAREQVAAEQVQAKSCQTRSRTSSDSVKPGCPRARALASQDRAARAEQVRPAAHNEPGDA